MKDRTILIADPGPDDAENISRDLAAGGFNDASIVHTTDGALRVAREHAPALLIINLSTAGAVSAAAAAADIRMRTGAPVIFLRGPGCPIGQEEIIGARPCCVLEAPVGGEILRVNAAAALAAAVDDALPHDERKFRTFVEYIIDWEYWIGTDGSIIHMNPSCLRITGHGPEEFVRDPGLLEAIVHPEDRIKYNDHVRVHREPRNENGPSAEISFRIVTPAGDVRWVEHLCVPVYGERGAYLGHRVSGRDISVRKNIEKMFNDSEERFKTLAVLAPIGIYLTDIAGDCIFANNRWCAIAGLTPQEAKGKGWAEAIHPDDRERMCAAWYDTVRAKGAWGSEYRFLDREGKITWVYSVAGPLCDSSGKVTGYIGANMDITARKLYEEELEERETRFSRISEITSDITYSCRSGEEKNYSIDWIMGATLHITGYSNEEIRARGCWRFLVIEEDLALFDKNVVGLAPATKGSCEFRVRHKNGGVVWISSHAECVTDPKAPGHFLLYGGLDDITAHKEMDDTVTRSNRLLDSIRKAQSLYIAEGGYRRVFGELLAGLVEISGSEYGFLDEVRRDADGGVYKLSLALTDISWDENSRKLYDELVARKLEFRNLDNLAGLPALTGKTVISNDPAHDPRAGGLPAHHPALRSYMGIPVYHGKELMGVAGMANREAGYDARLADFLQPLIGTCGTIIHSMRMAEQKNNLDRAVEGSEQRLRTMADAVSESVILMNPDGRVEFINECGARRLGLRPDEVVGRVVFDLISPEVAASRREKIGEVFATGVPVSFEDERAGLRLLHAVYPVRDTQGVVRQLAVYAFDVTGRRIFEKTLEESVREKEMLIKEIHHRVKNNFQVITSMLSLQGERIKNREVLDEFNAASERIRAMALVHEQLYYSENLNHIDFSNYLHILTQEISSFYRDPSRTIEIKIDCDKVFMGIDKAIPCGLIVNELITNAAKHAFPPGRCEDCRILVAIREKGDGMVALEVSDNGGGLPEPESIGEVRSFGFTLVNGLIMQIDGRLRVETKDGTSFRITFPLRSKPARKT